MKEIDAAVQADARVRARRARRRSVAAGADLVVGVADNQPKTPRHRRAVLRHDGRRRPDREPDRGHLGLRSGRRRSGTGPDRPRGVDGRGGARRPLTLSIYPEPGDARSRESPTAAGEFAAFTAHLARTYPTGQGLHRRQRAEQAAWLAAAVRLESQQGSLVQPPSGLLAASYDALKAVDPRITVIGVGIGRRAGTTTRPRAGTLDLARALHPRHGPRLPREQAEAADDGRDQLPSVPERRADSARDGLPLAERRRSEPRADQTGRLGCVQRHRPADFRGAVPRAPLRTMKVRLNEVGWQVAIPPGSQAAYLREGERRHDRRGKAGRDLRQPDPATGLRPGRAVAALLQHRGRRRTSTAGSRACMRADWTRRPSYRSSRARSPLTRRAVPAGRSPGGTNTGLWATTWPSSEAPGPAPSGTPPGASSPARRRPRATRPGSSVSGDPGRSRPRFAPGSSGRSVRPAAPAPFCGRAASWAAAGTG